MTNLHLANPFEQIAAQPRVVPVAVERVIQATVSGEYVNRRLLQDARSDLLTAQDRLSKTRRDPEAKPGAIEAMEAILYRALDRAWEIQCMVYGVFGSPPVPPASVLT
jgi:hypothetical protein